MNKKTLSILLSIILVAISGCSAIHKAEESVADIEQGIAETKIYLVTPLQAEIIIKQSFQEAWPDKAIEPLGANRLGYELQLWFAIDREHILAEAIKSQGGYLFKVTNRGTAPIVGVPARNKLIEVIEKMQPSYKQSMI